MVEQDEKNKYYCKEYVGRCEYVELQERVCNVREHPFQLFSVEMIHNNPKNGRQGCRYGNNGEEHLFVCSLFSCAYILFNLPHCCHRVRLRPRSALRQWLPRWTSWASVTVPTPVLVRLSVQSAFQSATSLA